MSQDPYGVYNILVSKNIFTYGRYTAANIISQIPPLPSPQGGGGSLSLIAINQYHNPKKTRTSQRVIKGCTIKKGDKETQQPLEKVLIQNKALN